jgi:CheY-like chemotaxis protein
VCAARLLRHPQNCRRVLAVGEAIEALSSLREIMGRARCSTAVAFDGGQALELAPLVRPSFALVDLSLPAADAIRVFRELRAGTQPNEVAFGATWTRPMDAEAFRRDLGRSVAGSAFSVDDLDAAVGKALEKMAP